MNDQAPIELDDIIDGQRVGSHMILLLIIAMAALISDGFDLAAIGYVGPELVKTWHITPSQLVPVFSAGIIGLAFGAPIFGLIGDRYGRKVAILSSLILVGLVTLASSLVTSLPQLLVLRFITGLGIGGVIPNVIALVAELAPTRLRGRLVVIVTLGVAAGIALPGFVAAALVSKFGWAVIFIVGGLLPLVVAFFAWLWLPESIRYLTERGDRGDAVRQLAKRMRPDLAIDATTQIAAKTLVPATQRGSVKQLFAGQLAVATPLLWVLTAANQMSNFFSLTWLPTLLQASGASTSQAGLHGSLFALGGFVGGLVLLFFIDRLGAVALVLLFFIGAPLVAGIGISGLSPIEHGLIIAGAGLCGTGINLGSSALLGIIYPTQVRSTGTGWTQAMGRIGALAAPLVGGLLLSLNFSVSQLLLAPAIVLALGGIASLALAVLCYRRFGSARVYEFVEERGR